MNSEQGISRYFKPTFRWFANVGVGAITLNGVGIFTLNGAGLITVNGAGIFALNGAGIFRI